MYDFNFFESLSPRGKHQESSRRTIISLAAFLALLLAIWPLYNIWHSYRLEKEIADLKTQVTQDKKYPLLEQAAAMKEYITERKGQLEALAKADEGITRSEWFNEAMLFTLLSSAPKDLRFNSIAVTDKKTAQITGNASSKPAIADLERNLRDSDRFTILHVQTMNRKEGELTYGFSMNLVLKGVSEDAAK